MRSILLLLIVLLPVCAVAGDPYDVTCYDLRIEPDIAARRVSLRASVSIDNPKRETEISFGLSDRYERIDIRDGRRRASYDLKNGIITVRVSPKSRVRLTFNLSGNLGDSRDDPRPVIDDETVYLLWSDRFYPITWDDWALMRTTIVLPAGFEVIAPGKQLASHRRRKRHRA
jgi:hypothetical protein